ncbi:protein SCO1/2 [Marinobacter antarcticus]|uniref:Protein SCO1/2 n=1 Tax=Marinobacter antarcticus TaxID=564117 RepID=A0A1M6QCS3_9GAMM|nr:SCO family protein [Marinobacter antarcticus]SHK17981.1 protein SCO1/2 [Marinobacter antarcticus]
MKTVSAILLMSAFVMAAALPFAQGLLNELGGESGFYGYKTDVSVPALPGAEVPDAGLNVVFFGYRSCGTVCPLQLLNLKALHERWQDSPVQFVFVTLDPENDSQRELNIVMEALGENFRAVRPENFRQAQALSDEYGDFAAREGGASSEINHGARLYVVAANNRRQLLYTTPELDLQRVNADLARLMEQPEG